MGRDTPLRGKKRKDKKIPCGKEKALWSGPLEFLGKSCGVFGFPFFFLMTRQFWISRCTLREYPLFPPPSVHSVLACLFWCSRRGKRRCMDSRPDKCRSDISCHGEDLVNSLGRGCEGYLLYPCRYRVLGGHGTKVYDIVRMMSQTHRSPRFHPHGPIWRKNAGKWPEDNRPEIGRVLLFQPVGVL